jgi:hypothetical protein
MLAAFTDSMTFPLSFSCAVAVLSSKSVLRRFDLARLSEVRSTMAKKPEAKPKDAPKPQEKSGDKGGKKGGKK